MEEEEEVFHLNSRGYRRGDVVQVKATDEKVVKKELLSRVGKMGGDHANWWQIKDTQSIVVLNTLFDNVVDNEENQENNAYIVNIPRYLHHEKRCIVAKEEELKKFEKIDVYSEEKDVGQEKLGTNWVLAEKVTEN